MQGVDTGQKIQGRLVGAGAQDMSGVLSWVGAGRMGERGAAHRVRSLDSVQDLE